VSLNERLFLPVKKCGRYDGTNGAEIVAHFSQPYNNETKFRFDADLTSEDDGVLTITWQAGWRNQENTSWEIHNSGVAELREGDYFALENWNALIVMPAELFGSEVAIIDDLSGEA
jgi:hypothetical protein